MHKKLLQEATEQQVREFADEVIMLLKENDEKLYEEAETMLYKKLYGCHFNKQLSQKAVSCMENEDGSTGEHWSIEQTTDVAKNYGITFDKFNEYDWYYTLNMIYSDYYGSFPNDLSYYVKVSLKFLNDKDSTEGKAFRYWESM